MYQSSPKRLLATSRIVWNLEMGAQLRSSSYGEDMQLRENNDRRKSKDIKKQESNWKLLYSKLT